MVICAKVVILCSSSSSLREVLGCRPCTFCASFIHAVSSGDGFSRKLSKVLFKWTHASCLSKNSVLVMDDLTHLMRVISWEPPNFASINCVGP